MSQGIPLTQDRITIPVLRKMKENKEIIAALSIYTADHAKLFDKAGGEVIIVGDSVEMVLYGEPNPKSATMDKMIYHTQAVRNGTKRLFIVGDMPLGSYEISQSVAKRNATRFMSEAGANAVKMEANIDIIHIVKSVASLYPVWLHIGLNPNKADMFGGYRNFGKTLKEVEDLCKLAESGERVGVSAILIESVPEEVVEVISRTRKIPVFSIAGGRKSDGQLLISSDLLGLYEWPGNRKPKHFRTYQAGEAGLSVGDLTLEAFKWYVQAVKKGEFPGEENSHFLPEKEKVEIEKYLRSLSNEV